MKDSVEKFDARVIYIEKNRSRFTIPDNCVFNVTNIYLAELRFFDDFFSSVYALT